MDSKISVVINTYNAEKHLSKVLDSVKDFDEIVICDMESTDSTVAIAKEHGCKVVTFPKGEIKIVEPARQFAIDSATHSWVLVLDADELVSPELREALYSHARKHTDATSTDFISGLWIARKNYFMGRFMHAFYPDYILRFFKKEGTIWPAKIHAFPVVEGKTERLPRSRKELAFEHLANDTMSDCIRKINEYTEDEANKRSGKNYGIVALLWRPFFRFFKAYFLKKGFLDGIPGLINALIQIIYQVALVGKVIERKRQRHNH